MAVPEPGIVWRLQGEVLPVTESTASTIGIITLGVKRIGKLSLGKPDAGFDVAGAGNVARWKSCDTRNPKGEQQGTQTST